MEEAIRRPRAIVGLGNPGSRYERTRHNAGFLVLDRWRPSRYRRRGDREEAVIEFDGRAVHLVRPLTFMNLSGLAVVALIADAALDPTDLLVISDDVALPSGRVRLRASGGSGGHRGLRSIEDALGTSEFARLRVGIGAAPPEQDLADYVLEPLEGPAWLEFEAGLRPAVAALDLILRDGVERSMNAINLPAPAIES